MLAGLRHSARPSGDAPQLRRQWHEEGSVAPSQDQFHLTAELTAGLTDHISSGFMELNARRPDNSLQYAGWRVLPHFYVPEAWHWPVLAGLVTEFSFQNTTYYGISSRPRGSLTKLPNDSPPVSNTTAS